MTRRSQPRLRRWAPGLLACFALGTAALSAQRDTRPPIDELVAAIQTQIDSVRSFSAAFEHTYAGGVLRTTLVERGTVQVQKPGKMRWTYTDPEEKLFVSDGVSLHSYIPFDRQVIVGSVPSGDDASTPALFLAGKGDLSDDFTAVYDEDTQPSSGTWTIGLTPTRSNVDYTRLVVVVDRASLNITQLSAVDFQGAVSTFTFVDFRENPALPDSLFRFDIPPGTDVIREESFRR